MKEEGGFAKTNISGGLALQDCIVHQLKAEHGENNVHHIKMPSINCSQRLIHISYRC